MDFSRLPRTLHALHTLPPLQALLAILPLCAFALHGCASVPSAPPAICEEIPGVPGPEDVALHGRRLLISSHDRRNWSSSGEIFAYSPVDGRMRALSRTGEPAGLSFRPHGIDVDASGSILYVILHDTEEDGPHHVVALYRIGADALTFLSLVDDALLSSPNDLVVLDDGSFFTSIDSVPRNSLLNLALGLKRGRIVHCEKSGPCRMVAEHLGYPNGLAMGSDGFLYVTTSTEDRLYRFRVNADHSLESPSLVADLPGGDNLQRDGDGLMTTSHPSGLAFIRHRRDATEPSPSVVYRIGERHSVAAMFADDGHRISAASVAVRLDGALYMGQVFNPYLLRCRYPLSP